jgi:hypothetical protein
LKMWPPDKKQSLKWHQHKSWETRKMTTTNILTKDEDDAPTFYTFRVFQTEFPFSKTRIHEVLFLLVMSKNGYDDRMAV